MPTTDSPLRYPGGKTQLTPFVIEVMRENELFHGTYVEPFAGGAGIAWRLLFDNYASEVWINDLDPSIHAFWNCVLHHTDQFCERIEKTPVTIEEWFRQRDALATAHQSDMDLGFATFFLNRTNRSGIIKGGVIGGMSQEGEYHLDCRFKKPDLIQRIRRIALYRKHVKLTNLDAREFLKTKVSTLGRQSLVNIDPPYYRKGPGLYCSSYKHQDHVDIGATIREIKQPWILTYDNAPEIRQIYDGLPMITKSLNYYAQVKRVGVELMVFSPTTRMPIEKAVA